MRLYDIIWKERFVNKIEDKHSVATEEVEQILFSGAHFRRVQKGRIKGEDLFVAYGQTNSGRHIVVFFIYKLKKAALPISARDMTLFERRYYERQK